ncbi:MAG: PAS domain S-box protein [Geothrix sp.]|uniref:PAS domain S-box protein n=1 Tax=Geothrix sp. TaxID=1962974 RepID=UPI00183850F9|nr:PAS domain S-box protein [Geothrix sp.]NWJ41971.1 PAS domain S-box protein [Geothrix sp.]WIL20056.1 MAG: PAS domain S-box protein [Geothrix sp.]
MTSPLPPPQVPPACQWVDSLPLAMVAWDPVEEALCPNLAFTELFGYGSGDLRDAGAWWESFLPDPATRQQLQGAWAEALRPPRDGSRPMAPMDLPMRQRDGSWRFVRAACARLGENPVITFTDLTRHHRTEEVLAFLASGALGPGEDFFQSLARFLAEQFAVEFVCIDVLEGDGLTAKTLAMWCDGRFEDNVSYALKDTPCGVLAGKAVCCFPSGVAASFPKDEVLRDLRAESYLGVTLWGHTGKPIGLIALIGRRPLKEPELAEALLKLVADRAAGELERRRAEEALRMSEAAHRHQFTDNSSVMLMIDPEDGRILDANRAATAFYGYAPERMLELHISDINILPEGELQRIMASIREDEGARFEFQHRLADGSLREVEVSSSRVLAGHRRVLYSIIHDITERKQAEALLRENEAKLRTIFEASEAGIILVSDRGEISFANRRMAEMFGMPLEQLIGTTYPEHLHPSERRIADARMRMIITGEIDLVSVERLFIRADGSTFWGHLSGRRLENPDGSLHTLVGIITDVTKRREAEERQQFLQAQLHQAQKLESLGSLAGGVAHDMNNVLGAILGLASAHIESQPAGSPVQRAFGTIIKAAERGGNMLKGLLSFARQNAVEEQQDLDLNAIMREEVRLLERTTLSKIRLEMDLDPALHLVRGDAGALNHAFMNLCVNAVDAMPENGTLTLRTRNLPSRWVEVQVQDTGMGMEKEVMDRALDPFFTTKEVGKGTGLGLSIVYSTVKTHQGEMELRSEPGQGTCVLLRFPASAGPAQPAEPSGAYRTLPFGGSLEVLLVDDDELIQNSMLGMLELLGHLPCLAATGEEALARVEGGLRPDVVILDMNMPGLGGAGTLPRLRALLPTVPVLLTTGRADQAAQDLVQAHRHVTLLSKPFGMKELQAHLAPFVRV